MAGPIHRACGYLIFAAPVMPAAATTTGLAAALLGGAARAICRLRDGGRGCRCCNVGFAASRAGESRLLQTWMSPPSNAGAVWDAVAGAIDLLDASRGRLP